MDYRPPSSSVYGISQARVLEWAAVSVASPGDLPNPGLKPLSPALAGRFFTTSHQGSPSRERIEERNTQPLLFPFLLPVSFHPSFPLSLPPMLFNSPMLKSGDQAAQGCNSSGSAPKDIEQSEEVVSGSEGASERCPASQPSRQMAKRLKCVC